MNTPAERPAQTYHERLWPSWPLWLVAAGVGCSFGLVAAPFGGVAALLSLAAGVAALGAMLVRMALRVQISDGELRAGRAHVPLHLLSGVQWLDREEMTRARGRELDARAFLCLAGWVGGGVRVDLDDPRDPTPYWLISSRHPERLAAALLAAVTTGAEPVGGTPAPEG